jgi:hypothetical protein
VMAFEVNASGTFQGDHWLFNHCFRLSHFPKSMKKAKFITLPKPGKDPTFPQNLRPISLLSTTGQLFEKVVLNIVQKHIEERNLLNASQFDFRARHNTTLQCMRLTDHVTLAPVPFFLCYWLAQCPGPVQPPSYWLAQDPSPALPLVIGPLRAPLPSTLSLLHTHICVSRLRFTLRQNESSLCET